MFKSPSSDGLALVERAELEVTRKTCDVSPNSPGPRFHPADVHKGWTA